jgi:nicotinamidase-related amidase
VATVREVEGAALLLIDVVNPLDFEGSAALLAHAEPALARMARLRVRAREAGTPCIFVNDNFDCWHLGFRELVEHVRAATDAGRRLLAALEPDPRTDFFVLKPMHSGFFQTALETLLARLRIRTLVLAGIAGDICVLFTANDAYMRGFELLVPADCVASESAEDNRRALAQMARLLHADVRPSEQLAFAPTGSARGEAGRARR